MGLSQNPRPLTQSHAPFERKPAPQNPPRPPGTGSRKDNQKNPIRRKDQELSRVPSRRGGAQQPRKKTLQPEEKHLLPKPEAQTWAKENHVEVHLTLPQNHLLLLASEEEEEEESPGETLEVHEHSLRPNNERLGLRLKLRGDEPEESPERPARPEKQEEEEEEDSSWTTLSQESPSVETPQDTGVWEEPPQVQDVSQEYFWRISADSTPREQPVSGDAHSDQEAEPSLKGACLPVPCTKAQTEAMGRAAGFLNNNYLVNTDNNTETTDTASASLAALTLSVQDLTETSRRER
ncbi:uncharacterized protein LOC122333597 [Puntigrus tetrazona]|uniref:uncharacterized protein LOC122333597 n=1 Tax=Puntigrus tetrazona TaxID=1606681 RepID=UPI001C88F377|nr:uncharacterized protein LOC122333597 [Puntigrus tetrazona]